MTDEGSRFLKRFLGRTRGAPRQPARREVPSDGPRVGLCFEYERSMSFVDDVLSDIGLEYVLHVLETHGLKATFNCPAKLCKSAPAELEMIVSAGHEICVRGYADESPRDLTDDALCQLVYTCRQSYADRGWQPIGFRAPHSHWDLRLCAELARQGFRYSAEHDHAKCLYWVGDGDDALIRVPIRTDDRGLRRREERIDETVSKHYRVLRKAALGRYFACVCFHCWILGEERQRFVHWEEWLGTAIALGVRLGPLKDALPDMSTDAAAPTLG